MDQMFRSGHDLNRLDGVKSKEERALPADTVRQSLLELGSRLPTTRAMPSGEDLISAYITARQWGQEDAAAIQSTAAAADMSIDDTKKGLIAYVQTTIAQLAPTEGSQRESLERAIKGPIGPFFGPNIFDLSELAVDRRRARGQASRRARRSRRPGAR